MDESFRVPGTNIRFGLDSLIGLFPGIGDVAGLLPHCYLFLQAYQVGVRKRVHVKMIANALLDSAFGTLPLVGDVFDVFWKSNRRNVELIRAEITRQQTLDGSIVEGSVVERNVFGARDAERESNRQ